MTTLARSDWRAAGSWVSCLLLLGLVACSGTGGEPIAGVPAGRAGAKGDVSTTRGDGGSTPSVDGVDRADAAALTCDGGGPLYPMSADPDTGAVDVSVYCLEQINGYRARLGLAPYHLHDTSAAAMCCQAAEAKTAAEVGGHANGGCGWQAQAYCGGGRNPDGNVKASVAWCPRLIFEGGPSDGHYGAMMQAEPRGIMCSYYAISRDRHSIVINYY